MRNTVVESTAFDIARWLFTNLGRKCLYLLRTKYYTKELDKGNEAWI